MLARYGDVPAEWKKLCRTILNEYGGYVWVEGQVYNLRHRKDYRRFADNFVNRLDGGREYNYQDFMEIYRQIPSYSRIFSKRYHPLKIKQIQNLLGGAGHGVDGDQCLVIRTNHAISSKIRSIIDTIFPRATFSLNPSSG